MHERPLGLRHLGWLVCAMLFVAATCSTAAPGKAIVIEGTQAAAVSPLSVYVELMKDGQVIKGEPNPLLFTEEPSESFMAFLDTGASAHVFSETLVERFKVAIADGAAYHEVALSGETAMQVTEPYSLRLAGTKGDYIAPQRHGDYLLAGKNVRCQVKSGGLIAGGQGMIEMNVIGMPAIRDLFIEISDGGKQNSQTDSLLGSVLPPAPTLSLKRSGSIPGSADAVIRLDYVDYNRRKHPKNTGPLPALEDNPMVRGLTIRQGSAQSSAGFLLDTGAVTSMISPAQAQQLGLYDANGEPVVKPDFYLPLAGVSGQVMTTPGYKLDELHVPAGGKTLIFKGVHAIVLDISITLDDGSTVTLDGIFGMNLLLPGMPMPIKLDGFEFSDPPFETIWLDGKRGKLGLQLR
ncbi:MAG: retropepsin-like aspartic protease [Phycisphaerales bacterium JB038]